MTKAIFAVLAVLGMSLAATARPTPALTPTRHRRTMATGATTEGNATGRAVWPAGGRRRL